MNFREYCGYKNEEIPWFKNISNGINNYLNELLHNQYHSLGLSEHSDINLKLEHKNKNIINISLKNKRKNSFFLSEITINERSFNVSIDSKYYKNSNIKNYLRECEIFIRDECSKVRRILKSP